MPKNSYIKIVLFTLLFSFSINPKVNASPLKAATTIWEVATPAIRGLTNDIFPISQSLKALPQGPVSGILAEQLYLYSSLTTVGTLLEGISSKPLFDLTTEIVGPRPKFITLDRFQGITLEEAVISLEETYLDIVVRKLLKTDSFFNIFREYQDAGIDVLVSKLPHLEREVNLIAGNADLSIPRNEELTKLVVNRVALMEATKKNTSSKKPDMSPDELAKLNEKVNAEKDKIVESVFKSPGKTRQYVGRGVLADLLKRYGFAIQVITQVDLEFISTVFKFIHDNARLFVNEDVSLFDVYYYLLRNVSRLFEKLRVIAPKQGNGNRVNLPLSLNETDAFLQSALGAARDLPDRKYLNRVYEYSTLIESTGWQSFLAAVELGGGVRTTNGIDLRKPLFEAFLTIQQYRRQCEVLTAEGFDALNGITLEDALSGTEAWEYVLTYFKANESTAGRLTTDLYLFRANSNGGGTAPPLLLY